MESKSLVRALSFLLSVVSVFMALCMITGLLLGEGLSAVKAFALPVALGIALFILSILTGRGRMTMSSRSGYIFVVFAWLSAALLGALPFMLSGFVPSLPAALFESMSGFTTTGATILTDIEAVPRSVLLWRATTHWLGGMGIVVLTVAILPLLGLNGRVLMEAEAPGPQVDKITPRISQTAGILWLIYLGLTIVLIVLLLFGGMDIIDAITQAFATIATGGFSTRNASIAAWDSVYIDVVITIFMLLGGTNFIIHWRFLQGKPRLAFRDSEWRVFLGIFAVSALLVAFNLVHSGTIASPWSALRYGSFQVATILTATGFATADYLQWPYFSQAVIFTLMFIGGCTGSTSGGIKVARVFTLFKMGLAEMRYLINPRGIYGIFVNREYMHKKIVYDIAAMVYLYLGTVLISTLVVAWGGFDIMTSLTSTLACMGTIGPGFSLVGPAFNYDFFPAWVKLWLTFVMLIGRLEVYTVLVLFTRVFWKR